MVYMIGLYALLYHIYTYIHPLYTYIHHIYTIHAPNAPTSIPFIQLTHQGRAPPLVPLKEFYNDGVNSMISLKEDYRRWRRRVAMREDAGSGGGGAYWREGKDSERPSFAFCEHPYVLEYELMNKRMDG